MKSQRSSRVRRRPKFIASSRLRQTNLISISILKSPKSILRFQPASGFIPATFTTQEMILNRFLSLISIIRKSPRIGEAGSRLLPPRPGRLDQARDYHARQQRLPPPSFRDSRRQPDSTSSSTLARPSRQLPASTMPSKSTPTTRDRRPRRLPLFPGAA